MSSYGSSVRALNELPREIAAMPRQRGAIVFAIGCGVLALTVYIATDLPASASYPGYSGMPTNIACLPPTCVR